MAGRGLRIGLAALFVLLLWPRAAWADFDLSTLPSSATLPAGRTTPTYTVRWVIRKSDLLPPLVSDSGTFIGEPGGVVLGTNPVTLIDPGLVPPLFPITSTLSERLRVPPAIVQRAQELGLQRIAYERTFLDQNLVASNPSRITFAFAGSLSGPFQLLRFQLLYDDDSTLRMVSRDASLRAVATVSYAGTGTIEAIWELADSGSTSGQPIFRQIRRDQRYLGPSGRVRIESPDLPTAMTGLHLLRLRVLEPPTAFPLPVIRYFVTADAGPGEPRAPLPVRLKGPPHLAPLADDTPFAWAPVERAGAYQLDIYEKVEPGAPSSPDEMLQPPGTTVLLREAPASGPFVAGMMLPPGEREVMLSPPARARLAPGRSYLWRVRAIAADGSVVGESPLREIRVPAAAGAP